MSKKIGRPTKYSEKLAEEICYQITTGISLTKICEPSSMPTKATVYNWLRKYEDFLNLYTLARQFQAETFIDDSMDVTRILSDSIQQLEGKGKDDEIKNERLLGLRGVAQAVGVIVKNNTILMEKLAPKKFTIAYLRHGDPDGNPLETASKQAHDQMQAQLKKISELAEKAAKTDKRP
jgi:Bacteriophage Sf6, terminase small subunit-like